MIELTQEQCEAVQKGEHSVRDPTTNTTYVLVPQELYANLKRVLDDDLPDTATLMNEAMAEDDAGDPLLESYQHYRSPS